MADQEEEEDFEDFFVVLSVDEGTNSSASTDFDLTGDYDLLNEGDGRLQGEYIPLETLADEAGDFEPEDVDASFEFIFESDDESEEDLYLPAHLFAFVLPFPVTTTPDPLDSCVCMANVESEPQRDAGTEESKDCAKEATTTDTEPGNLDSSGQDETLIPALPPQTTQATVQNEPLSEVNENKQNEQNGEAAAQKHVSAAGAEEVWEYDPHADKNDS